MHRVGLITAGLGSDELIAAGKRVEKAACKFGILSFVKVFSDSELGVFAPRVFEKYKKVLNAQTKGFGYFAWKPELILSTLRNLDWNLDLVIWVDAGCEMNPNPISKTKFNFQIKAALKKGYFFYDLDYPEERYTKRDVLEKFPKAYGKTRQIQATYFMVSKSHVKLIEMWTDYVLEDLHNIDLSPSLKEESKAFVEHRFDQSLLSLLVKSQGLSTSPLRPCGGVNSVRSAIRGLIEPVWTIRNRTGESLIKDQISSAFMNLKRK